MLLICNSAIDGPRVKEKGRGALKALILNNNISILRSGSLEAGRAANSIIVKFTDGIFSDLSAAGQE
jgi:hypothetical protein